MSVAVQNEQMLHDPLGDDLQSPNSVYQLDIYSSMGGIEHTVHNNSNLLAMFLGQNVIK